jgi:predicted aspartyl protease
VKAGQPSRGRAIALVLGCLSAAVFGADPSVAIEMHGRVLFLKASINNQGPFRLILDTGATETVITPPVANRLGIRTVAVSASQRKGTVTSLAVGTAAVTNLPVYVFDPPQAVSLRLDEGADYHGLLGYTFLSRFLTTLDCGLMQVSFTPLPTRSIRVRADGTDSNGVPFEVVEHLIRIPVRVNGSAPLRFLFDTGSAEVVLFPPTARALGFPAPPPGDASPRFAEAASVSIGTARMSRVRVVAAEIPDTRVTGNFQGIIGHPFLSNFAIAINYRDRVIRLSPASRPLQ